MDSGKWAVSLAGGAEYEYDLPWVVALACLMVIHLQVIAARLGTAAPKVQHSIGVPVPLLRAK